MLPFTKLNTPGFLIDPVYQNSIVSYGKGTIEFFKIPEEIKNKLLTIIPEEYRKEFDSSIMRINDVYIRPHTDSDRKVGINFYIKTDRAITTFFNKKLDTKEAEKVKGQTNGFVYNEANLETGRKFIANAGEIWILDVSKIHSVINPRGTERVAYTLSSNTLSYEDTVKILKDLISPT